MRRTRRGIRRRVRRRRKVSDEGLGLVRLSADAWAVEAAIDSLGGAATGRAGRFLAVALVLAATVQADVDERNRMRLGIADECRRVHGGSLFRLR